MVVLGAALEAHWLCGPTLLGGGGLAAEEVVLAGSRQLGDGGWPSQSVTPIWAQRVADSARLRAESAGWVCVCRSASSGGVWRRCRGGMAGAETGLVVGRSAGA